MRIDVYDFDGTIYDGDSTVDFTRFCLRRHPGVLAGLPKFLGTSLRLAAGRRSQTQKIQTPFAVDILSLIFRPIPFQGFLPFSPPFPCAFSFLCHCRA